MILANDSIATTGGHIVLEEVSWEFYEHLLKEIGDGHLRVTYDQGRMEIMSPLARHERPGEWISLLIRLIAIEKSVEVEALGSTTFKMPILKKGLEPDKCFYVKHVLAAREFDDEFDPAIHPAPDLVLEIDVTRRHVPRQPIYAALGVREIWCFDGSKLRVLHLSSKGKYVARAKSQVFPFLPIAAFGKFCLRMKDNDQLRVLREFREWLGKLPG